MKEVDTFYMSEKQIEQMKRKKNWNKKMAKSAVLFLSALAAFLTAGVIPKVMVDVGMSESFAQFVHYVLRSIHAFGSIAGVMTFAKALHNPLTEQEAKELEERETFEKEGRSR